jgi:hypothetical protein
MSILEQYPLFARQPGVRCAAIRIIASAAPAKDERTSVTRIVQDVQRSAVWEFRPHQITFVRPLLQPPWKQEFFLPKSFHDRAGRSCTLE